ncbi:SH3R2 ligase, partial [Psilopogon haemacephalus]|nr:SH3R2 ligase [Psilopogon haemacephalus]
CPVCFEKLDATAKVLPCQHTFCKPCLQRILKSQKELRCPECRTLVLCSIEQLPSNLLLIRLLDGVRCGQNVSRFGSIQRSGVLSSPASIRRVPRGLQLHQHRLATNPRTHMEGVPRAKALYTYRGHNPGELRFNKGDIIVLLRQLDENWYLGEVNGTSGVFPASSVQVIKHLPLPAPLGRALYSLDLRSRDKLENKDSLTFHKVPPPDGAGRFASLGFRQSSGHLPALCLFQPNPTARQLLQSSKGHWSPQLKSASLRTASPKGKAGDSAAFAKVPDSRRKSLRQFSITTALNTLNRMVHAPGDRQALEISSPVLISSSNPTVATQSSEKAELPYSTPIQVSASYYPTPGSLGQPAAIVTLPHLQQHMSSYIALFSAPLGSSFIHIPSGMKSQAASPCSTVTAAPKRWLLPLGANSCSPHIRAQPQLLLFALSHRKSSLSDSKMPSLYASWTLSTSSLSSQGSISENGPRQSRPLKAALLPVPIPSPGRSMGTGQASLRRGRGSTRKSGSFSTDGSLQRPGQAATPVLVAGSLRRPAMAALRPQQLQLFHTIPPGASMAEAAARQSFSQEASPAVGGRGGESRSPSVCSSVILDAKEPPAKSEVAPKPPASAPPSILVKPDTSRNNAEKQVKTVRFQNHSPPPPKRH